MTKARFIGALLRALLMVSALGALRAAAQEAVPTIAAPFFATVDIMPDGRAYQNDVFTLDPANYATLKRTYPDPKIFLRLSGTTDPTLELDKRALDARYDDKERTLSVFMAGFGNAMLEVDGAWHAPIPADCILQKTESADGRPAFRFKRSTFMLVGMTADGEILVRLPKGAADARWNSEKNRIEWKLLGPASGEGRLKLRIDTPDNIMLGAAEAYTLGREFAFANAGRAVLTNTGEGPIKNLKIRFRAGRGGDWTEFTTFASIYPGQTVIALAHTRFAADAKPDNVNRLYYECRYDTERGAASPVDGQVALTALPDGRLVLGNDLETAPMIASWLPLDDPPVNAFAALAKSRASVEPTDSASVGAMVQAVYQVMCENGFKMGLSLASVERTKNGDLMRLIRDPRDIIRTKTGSNLELACLWTAVLNAAGVHTLIAVGPTTFLPMAVVPNNQGVLAIDPKAAVDANGDFTKLVSSGFEAQKKLLASGVYAFVDPLDMKAHGFVPRRLPPLADDILATWGYATGLSEAALLGNWTGQIREMDASTQAMVNYDGTMTISKGAFGGLVGIFSASISTTNNFGQTVTVRLDETFDITVKGQVLSLRGTRKSATVVQTGETTPIEDMDSGDLTLNGKKLTGKVGNPSDGMSDVTLEKR